jgi:ribose transport system substrate-binding protein
VKSKLLLAAALATGVATSAAAEDKITIGYAVMGYNHPLFQAMMDGAEQGAKTLNVDLIRVDAQFDVNKQIGQIEDFITRKVSALLVNPVTAKETVPVLEKARAAGIPVIAIDTRPVGFEPDAFVTMNHFQGGYIIGWKVANDLNCKGRWSAIWAVGNEQAASRMRGFETGMDEACKVRGLDNKFQKEGSYSGITGPLRETSRQIAQTLLTKYPQGDLAFIFGQTDEFANGAYLATQAAGREDVRIYGMDNNSDMRDFIKENKNMIATTAHLPVEVGRAAVQTAVNIVRKQPYLKEVQLNFQLIDQANVQYDPGWKGTYHPSFSAFAFPEQLKVLTPAP